MRAATGSASVGALPVAIVAALSGSLVTPWAVILLLAPFVEGQGNPAPSGSMTRLIGIAFLLCGALGTYLVVRWLKRPPRA